MTQSRNTSFTSTDMERKQSCESNLGKLESGEWLSESALWVEWYNRGRLSSISSSHFYPIDAKSFVDALMHHRNLFAWTVSYAKQYVYLLWQQEQLSDRLGVLARFEPLQPKLLKESNTLTS